MSRTSITRTLTLTAGALLAAGAVASAAPSTPTLRPLPEFGTGRDLNLDWSSAAYTAKSGYRNYEVSVTDLTTGIVEKVDALPSFMTLQDLFNGHQYRVRVRASERVCTFAVGNACLAYSPLRTYGPYSDDQQTRIDATSPTGSLEINAGAAFTNTREVTVGLAATDPLSNGEVPSGLARMRVSATDVFPCDPAPLDTSGCLTPFATSTTRTLAEGPDGVRTVRAQFEDAAYPAGSVFVVGSPTGNLSPVVTDTIVLDTTAPTIRITQSAPRLAPGGSLSVSAATSTDGASGPADSGIDPESITWQFGDGTTGTGLETSHTYTTAGTYQGRMNIRDRAGNPATATFQVVVGAGAVVQSRTLISAKRVGAVRQFRTARVAVTISRPSTVLGVLVKRGRGDDAQIVRRVRKAGAAGQVTLRFTAPKAGRYELRLRAGADEQTLMLRVRR